MLITPPARFLSALPKFLSFIILTVVGVVFFRPSTTHYFALYWTGWAVVSMALSARFVRTLAANWHFQSRARAVLPAKGPDLDRLTAAATTVRQNHEERALYILQNMSLRSVEPEVLRTRSWLQSFAAVRWMERQKPGRVLSGLYHKFPQLHAVVFSAGSSAVPVRSDALVRELRSAATEELDNLARDYILLTDILVASINDPNSLFADEAERLLSFCTDRRYTLNAGQRFDAWWSGMRPVLTRGGGAFIVGLRLLQRENYAEAAELLTRLEEGGMLSEEAETIRRAAAFLALFARPLWRMTGADIPRYFEEGCYYLAGEMGVLRYPTAELPEVARCCHRGEHFHSNKRRLIEDTLELWETVGDDAAVPLSLLLKRLLEHKAHRCSNRYTFWRDAWINASKDFERTARILMKGVAAASSGNYRLAERHFIEASKLDPNSSTPLVDLLHVFYLSGETAKAAALEEEIVKRFGKDGPTLVALGRMALQRNEATKAEKLLNQALDHLDPPTEALIWLGEVKLVEGLYLESQHYFDYAKQLDSQLPEPKFGLARIYMETQRFELAIENLNSIVQQGPEAARELAYYMLYRAYRQKGNDTLAFEYLDKIPTQFFKEPDLLEEIAIHLEGEKRYSKAREFAERAMILRAGRQGKSDENDAINAF
jgi:tetratricopeptide (TPR) repeat protein